MQKIAPYTIGTTMVRMEPTDAEETQVLDYNQHAITYVTINAIKELASKVNELEQTKAELVSVKSELALLEAKVEKLTGGMVEGTSGSQGIVFYQNNPNPFSTSTTVSFSLPEPTKNAELVLSIAASGQEVMRIPLQLRSNQVQVSADNLRAGQYLYTIVADGISMPAKKMTVIK